MKTTQLTLSVLSLALVLTAGTASAASACKGLSETACAATPACGWTQGYTRKDGRPVAAYCRVKPAKAKAAAVPASATPLPKG